MTDFRECSRIPCNSLGYARWDTLVAEDLEQVTAIEMLMRTRSAFGIEIPMDAFFRSSTLRETSEIIEERLVAEIASLSDEEVAQLLGSS